MAFEPGLHDCGDVVKKKKPHFEILIRDSEWVKIQGHPDVEVSENRGTAHYWKAF
jgi:hypothetical protein